MDGVQALLMTFMQNRTSSVNIIGVSCINGHVRNDSVRHQTPISISVDVHRHLSLTMCFHTMNSKDQQIVVLVS